MDDRSPFLGLVIILILMVAHGIISGAAASIKGLNEGAVKKKADAGDRKSIKLLKMIDEIDSYSNTVKVVLMGIQILIGFFYAFWCYKRVKMLNDVILSSYRNEVMTLLIMIVFNILLLYVVILFGRILPEKFGIKNAEKTAYRLVGIINGMTVLLRPFTFLLECSTNMFLAISGINPRDLEENVTEEEIISIVNEGHEKGILEASEAEMISNIIEFDEKEVRDIMTRKKKIVAISTDMSVDEALKFMLSESYSRFPLYEENMDNIVGILYIKDITKYYISNEHENKNIRDFARKPYFVPDTLNIDVLFKDMQKKKVHMAIAVDEYGQTAGLVAMEDILEEIVGNILDEYDVDERFIIEQGVDRYIMNGQADLEEVQDKLKIKMNQDDYDTLNGFLISLLDRIPQDGEKLRIYYEGYLFNIIDVHNKTIRYVKVTKDKRTSLEVNNENIYEI